MDTIDSKTLREVVKLQRQHLDALQKIPPAKPITIKVREGSWPKGEKFELYGWLDYKTIWTDVVENGEPIYTRSILRNEIVFDPDVKDWDTMRKELEKLKVYLDRQEIPSELAYSGGKACHLHIFFDSFDIDKSDFEDAKKYDVDLWKCTREALAEELLKNADVDSLKMGLDWGKIRFRTKGSQGSQVREYGTTRKDGKYKTLIDEIPETNPDKLPLRFPAQPKLWSITGTNFHQVIRDKVKVAVEQAKTRNEYNLDDVSFADTDVMQFPCVQKIKSLQLKNGRYYAVSGIGLLCKMCGYSREDTSRILSDILNTCRGLTQSEIEHRLQNSLKMYDADYHFSCRALKDKVDGYVCDYTRCPLKEKINTKKQDTGQSPVDTVGDSVEELSREEIIQKGSKSIDLKLTINVPEGHLIHKFDKYVGKRSDAYPDYAHCAALWILSACTQGKAVLELAQGEIRPNLWFMLFGLSSVSRKSTVLGFAKRKYETCTGDYIANHEYSIQGYYEDLEDHRVRNFIRDEAAGQLHNMHKKHNDGMVQVECLVYDGQSITKKLASKKGKKDEVHVRDPYVTKLDATTPDNYFSAINTDDLHSGFVPRYLYCHPKYQRPRMPLRMADGDTTDDTELIIAISSIWDHFTRCETISFTVYDDAMNYYNQCVEQMEDRIMETGDNLLSMGWARNQVHILKIAMLLEIGMVRVSTHISLETMQEAVRVVTEYFLPMFMETAGRIQHTDLYNKIEKVRDVLLKNNGTVDRSTLLRYSRLLKDDFDKVIQTMLESGEIEVFQEKDSKQRWYVLKADLSHASTNSHNSHVHMGIKNLCEKREFNISNHNCNKTNSIDNGYDKKEEINDNSSLLMRGYVLNSPYQVVETVKHVNLCEIEGKWPSKPNLDEQIEASLDQWEKFGDVIFSGNAHQAKLDIVKYHQMHGINSQLIFAAVDNRASQRCVDCGSDEAPNRSESLTGGTQYRCREWYQEYQKLNPVKLPEMGVV